MSDPRLPRREFIATGVGLAAAALTSTRVDAIPPKDKINVGIVGCGVRGNYILGEAIAAGAGEDQCRRHLRRLEGGARQDGRGPCGQSTA